MFFENFCGIFVKIRKTENKSKKTKNVRMLTVRAAADIVNVVNVYDEGARPMSSNPTGVKQYSMVRDYLSWIYLYGYFSREDFARLLPKKTASFDVCIKYIKDIYPELMDGKFRGKKKYLALDRAAQVRDEDPLACTFFLSSLSDEELSTVLQLLQETAREPARAASLAASIDEPASASTARRCIKELETVGYLREGKSKKYHIAEDRLRTLSDEALTDLYRYVRFCGNVTYPRVPARFLLRSVERELLYRGMEVPKTAFFRFLNNPNHNVMDEDLVFTLLQIIREQRNAEITMLRGGELYKSTVTPICLRIDRRLGRWYLLSMEERPTIRRLTRIQTVKPADECAPQAWEEAASAVRAAFANSRFSGHLTEDGPTELRMELRFENEGLERQFLRELRGGSIEAEGEKRVYHDTINDPIELVPLLRSYAPWLVPEDPDGLAAQRIREDLLLMRRQLSGEGQT